MDLLEVLIIQNFQILDLHKYPFMIHAEANAIYNAVRQGKSTQGMRVYVTGKPCA